MGPRSPVPIAVVGTEKRSTTIPKRDGLRGIKPHRLGLYPLSKQSHKVREEGFAFRPHKCALALCYLSELSAHSQRIAQPGYWPPFELHIPAKHLKRSAKPAALGAGRHGHNQLTLPPDLAGTSIIESFLPQHNYLHMETYFTLVIQSSL